MNKLNNARRSSTRLRLTIAFLIITCFGAIVYFVSVPNHPPGFYIDESSIAFNAHLISQTGSDEHGETWPLYFRAFGDYKNPTYIYLLAGLFKLMGPSIAVARSLSAGLGLAGGILLGLLAWKITRRIGVVIVVALSAFLTPWLYESSRMVFEVALYPLLTALFLLALWRASRKQSWQTSDVVALTATLALLTYSYSIGRLLAPLLAAGLALFLRRHGWRSVMKVWLGYVVTLIPLLVFYRQRPGSLSDRFTLLTYITSQSSVANVVLEFFRHYLANLNPWRWLMTGENNVRDHLSGFGSLLAATVVLGVGGAVMVLRRYRREPWWQFILYGCLVSVIPASLTRTEFPQLRLIAFPMFFHVLMIPALAWLMETSKSATAVSTIKSKDGSEQQRTGFTKRAALLAAVSLILVQGFYFQWRFHETGKERWYVFDARFPHKVLAVALETGQRPIYLFDPPGNSGYIQAYWYGVVQGVDPSLFVRLPSNERPPPGSLVISSEEECANCKLIAKSINYTVYAVLPSSLKAKSEALPENAFRARMQAENMPATLPAGATTTISVLVKNVSGALWPAVGEPGTDQYAVVLRNRWLRSDGTVVNYEDDLTRLPYDLEPGDTAGVQLKVKAPETPGQYVLELDVVEERVTWFGDKGSERLTFNVIVGPRGNR
ncbi:MAG TPA: hypothetical protein VNO50_16290 [Pyrinomonadaceae bacterium]|nr:hypothetical protein [Pyrinomonadaceae bacterium]